MNTKDQWMMLQFATFFARAMLAHAEVTSGAYKFRKTQVGCGKDDNTGLFQFREETEEEKLQSALGTMRAHIDHMQEFVSFIENMVSK